MSDSKSKYNGNSISVSSNLNLVEFQKKKKKKNDPARHPMAMVLTFNDTSLLGRFIMNLPFDFSVCFKVNLFSETHTEKESK